MRSLLIHGMHGLGDNIYSRAVLRHYRTKYSTIWFKTPWPQLFHDMPDVHMLDPRSPLRTQRKNSERSAFEMPDEINVDDETRVFYSACHITSGRYNSLPNAMFAHMHCPTPGDYRLPVPMGWIADALRKVGMPEKPILVYRPLTVRQEWAASTLRNPDPVAYLRIFASIRDRFFVVAVADIDPDNEVAVSYPIKPDLSFCYGELSIELLCGLYRIASCVYASPGFSLALSQAVETPSITVFGGHEGSRAYRSSANFAPALMIDPISPCNCFDKTHHCLKMIDIPAAVQSAGEWCDDRVLSTFGAFRDASRDSLPAGDVVEAVHGMQR